jgi:hypothetical protein
MACTHRLHLPGIPIAPKLSDTIRQHASADTGNVMKIKFLRILWASSAHLVVEQGACGLADSGA